LFHLAQAVERQVLREQRRADRSMADLLRRMPDLTLDSQRFLSECLFSLFRWRGWLDQLAPGDLPRRLLLSSLLDQNEIRPEILKLAQNLGIPRERLRPLPASLGWAERIEILHQIVGSDPAPLDPLDLIPGWILPHLLKPVASNSPADCWLPWIQAIQQPPELWIRSNQAEPEQTWRAFALEGLQPHPHPHLRSAAWLARTADLPHRKMLDGLYAVQDLASQGVGAFCDPDPGERWWDVCAGAGGKALDLAARMRGKGLVIATDTNSSRLRQTAARARAAGLHNIQTRLWNGRSLIGKPGRFDGVLVDAPCSGIGTWRANPDARWTLQPDAIPRLSELQLALLAIAAKGVKPGGTLVYSVCTLTSSETESALQSFLQAHPEFTLDPAPHPLSGLPTSGACTLWPHLDQSNGMYLARCVRRVSDSRI
jgi:16S rRNA (cytosine967-C5)-methyltransferase